MAATRKRASGSGSGTGREIDAAERSGEGSKGEEESFSVLGEVVASSAANGHGNYGTALQLG